jgi:hypothetical protein
MRLVQATNLNGRRCTLVGASASTAPVAVVGLLLSGYALWVFGFSAYARGYLDSGG